MFMKICVRSLVVAVVLGGLYVGYRYLSRYPYGRSHSCDNVLLMALQQYAKEHDGWFPHGEATPEASLSLVHREDWANADVLRGKTVPLPVAAALLENGELLTPETCGWHYVEGLRLSDDGRLALFWDKAGLGHNGEVLRGGGRYVSYLRGKEYIPKERWQEFLAEQAGLRAKIRDRRTPSQTTLTYSVDEETTIR